MSHSITENTEMAAFGLGLLRSWYVSQKSQRAQKILFADAHKLFHTESTENTENTASPFAASQLMGHTDYTDNTDYVLCIFETRDWKKLFIFAD